MFRKYKHLMRGEAFDRLRHHSPKTPVTSAVFLGSQALPAQRGHGSVLPSAERFSGGLAGQQSIEFETVGRDSCRCVFHVIAE